MCWCTIYDMALGSSGVLYLDEAGKDLYVQEGWDLARNTRHMWFSTLNTKQTRRRVSA